MNPIPSRTLASLFEGLDRIDIDDWVETHRIEDLTLDFKTAPKNFEDRDERKMLAKAISGFANASGGLIVWGVVAVRDQDGLDAAQSIEPIKQPSRFLSNLTSYAGAAISPSLPGVVHRLVNRISCAVTLVPESDGGPYMANLGQGRYFTRSGSSFYQMEHFQVLDAMNRRQRPDLRVSAEITAGTNSIVVSLLNLGRVSAKAPYLELQPSGPWVLSPYGVDGNGLWNIPRVPHSGRENSRDPRFGGNLITVIQPQTRLDLCVLDWRGAADAKPPAVELQYAYAAEDVPLTAGMLTIPMHSGAKANS